MRDDTDLPTPIRKLLLDTGLEPDAPYTRRIFTNRDLRLDTIPVVGFDMDYTLALYRQEEIEQLSLRCTIDKLMARGYPEALGERAADPAFAIRGLTVDRVCGNVLKMDRHGYVGRAFHGRTSLSRAERKELYRDQRLGEQRERFVAVDTLFALPEVSLYAEVVERIDAHPETWQDGDVPTYAEAWTDVRQCIDEAHRDGSIKAHIEADPGRYIEEDPDLPRTLHKFRSAGKRLFLLTNSLYPYSDKVLRFLLGGRLGSYPEWQAYFDWVVVGAGKPAFFTEGRAFLEVDRKGMPVGRPHEVPQRGKAYEGGNQTGLQRALGVHADEVLYVGDHIYGDIVRSKKSSGWRTVLIVQELERDLAVRMARAVTLEEIESLHRLRAQLAEEISADRHLSRVLAPMKAEQLAEVGIPPEQSEEMLESTRSRVRARLERLRRYHQETSDTLERRSGEVDAAFNPYWGSAFAEGQDTSRFGAQVEFYACLYTSRVSNFQYVSPAKYFRSPHGSLPHWLR